VWNMRDTKSTPLPPPPPKMVPDGRPLAFVISSKELRAITSALSVISPLDGSRAWLAIKVCGSAVTQSCHTHKTTTLVELQSIHSRRKDTYRDLKRCIPNHPRSKPQCAPSLFNNSVR